MKSVARNLEWYSRQTPRPGELAIGDIPTGAIIQTFNVAGESGMVDPSSHSGSDEDAGLAHDSVEQGSAPPAGAPQPKEPTAGSESYGLIVGIGASAGGLDAFSELLRNLPANTGMAFVLVQHLDPTHPSMLADLLANYTDMPVVQASGDVPVKPDHVYVIPPNATMLLADGSLRVTRPAQESSHQRRPIDAFFISLAESMHHRAIGVVLSGAASDGTRGLEAIKAEGGLTYAQDATAKFDSMPQSAIAAGVVDFILPPHRIARELAVIAHQPLAGLNSGQLPGDSSTLDKIRATLRMRSGVDFGLYKQSTVQRRLARRMMVQKADTLERYLDIVRRDPGEVDALFDDLLIKVTEFFRDAPVFDALKKKVFPFLTKDRSEGEPLRIWVPGCSTGEEIYSIAITLLEYLEAENLPLSVQIFGSDASERVISKARTGVYHDSISTVSPERLQRFFTRSDSGYQVNPNVREMCIFSRHVLGLDPPLSRMDLISCRNLLIYFAPALQQRVVDTLAYALKPTGYLLVGPSENVGRLSQCFDVVDEEHRIYGKKSSLDPRAVTLIPNIAGPLEPKIISVAKPLVGGPQAGRGSVRAFVDQMLLSRYGPSALVVDKGLRIVGFRGDINPYLKAPAGEANLDLLNLVREDLASHLSASILEAHQHRSTVRLDEIQVRQDRGFRFIRITLVPISLPATDPHTVILFEELADSAELALKQASTPPPKLEDGSSFDTPERHIEHLERELASSREYLQSIIEELRSTNEEAQSANEELQSSNEELQTTKEEIQSTNEELATVNAEIAARNTQLTRLNDDLTNLLSSISTSIVMIGGDLRICRFTPTAAKVLHLIPGDVGRPISDLAPRINVPNLDEVLRGVLDTLKEYEQEVNDVTGQTYLMRVRPYRTADDHIDGVVLVLTEITELRRGVEEIRRARDYASAIVETVRESLLVLDDDLVIRSANRAFYEFFRSSPQQIHSQSLYTIENTQLDLPPVRELLNRLRAGETQLRDVEIEHTFQPLGHRTLLLNARRITGAGLILLAFEDITERKHRQATEARYRRLFESARDGIVIVDEATGEILDVNPYSEQLFGYSRKELVGQRLWEIELARDTSGLRAMLEQIRDQGAGQFSDTTFTTKDGRSIQTEFIGGVYLEGDRPAIQLNIRDLTERRKFERELQHTQRLESLGLLAGGVSHDFNNLLVGIMGNASLVYANMPDDNPQRIQLRSIIRASEQAAELTRQLLAYAGKGRFITEQIDLSTLIREILALLQGSISKSVELKLDLTPDLPPFVADPTQIQQLVMNLVINGAEAIGEGNPGVVEIRTGKRELLAREIRENFTSEALTPGTYVYLEVKDTGSGMDEATKVKIFDPFFTTKFTGRGLGLAAVSGIVGTLRGAIRVYSTPGQGSTFYILFPRAAPAPPPRPTARLLKLRRLPDRSRDSATILVIDDNSVALQTTRAILEQSGFEVLLAENGQTGVDLFRKEKDRVSLIILDLTMPVMGGEQALDLLRAIRSNIPILLTSGYDESEVAERLAGRDLAGFIHKPCDAPTLLQTVASVLGPGAEE